VNIDPVVLKDLRAIDDEDHGKKLR
jgi:hypothetical protein